jgi:hypothetical protein
MGLKIKSALPTHNSPVFMNFLVIFGIILLSINWCGYAQQKGIYLTMDQTKEITFLDSAKIIIKETNFKRNFEETVLTGTFRRRLCKLTVFPVSYTRDGEMDSEIELNRMEYKIKHVTGQKFLIKRADLTDDYQEYFLRLYP